MIWIGSSLKAELNKLMIQAVKKQQRETIEEELVAVGHEAISLILIAT